MTSSLRIEPMDELMDVGTVQLMTCGFTGLVYVCLTALVFVCKFCQHYGNNFAIRAVCVDSLLHFWVVCLVSLIGFSLGRYIYEGINQL